VAVLAATAAVAAACGSSGGGSSAGGGAKAGSAPPLPASKVLAGPPTGWSDAGYKPAAGSLKCPTTASNPTRGITDKQITIGGLAYLTSPNGSSMVGTDTGSKVRFDRVNAEGGINGRKINYVGTLDDGEDPSRNGQQAKVLVDQKKVFAAVPVMTAASNYLDTFCAETVPFFGWGFNQGFCNSSIGFGITGCQYSDPSVTSSAYGVLLKSLFGAQTSGKTAALVGVDNDSARAGNKELAAQISTVGVKVVYNQTPVPVAGLTDTTAVVNAIMRANGGSPPDVVIYVVDFQSVAKLTGALAAAGFQGKNVNPVGYDPRLAGFGPLQKSYTVLQWEPGFDTSVPAIKQMAADFAKYAPGDPISLPAMAGYWSADMFTTAATKVGRNLNLNSLLKLMNDNYSNYVPGALPQTRWPLNHAISSPCGSIVQLNGKQYTLTSKLACGSLIRK
jgi:ABC-type branched-subunit amino acid transport system substrate-binding protein